LIERHSLGGVSGIRQKPLRLTSVVDLTFVNELAATKYEYQKTLAGWRLSLEGTHHHDG
jgi:hypothetical protein